MNPEPLEYRAGRERGERIDAELAGRYLAHTRIGDPAADAVIEAARDVPREVGQRWFQAGIEGGAAAIPDAPEVVRNFFSEIDVVPDWFDLNAVRPGCRAFHRHSEMFVGAFVGAVLIEGFSTLISKSFSITGRLVDQGTNRLKQNNRHLLEIFMPGGLDRHSDGWKLSVRIRLVHARVRWLLKRAPDWDEAAWGVPLSSAHIAFATAAFSGLLLKRAEMLGVRLSAEERESFILVWRYAGRLMGVSDELLFDSERSALKLHAVGAACEPPPGLDSILLANGLINSAPIVAGITDPVARRKLTAKIYRISRALIGNEMADALNYPPTSTLGVLSLLQWRNRLDAVAQKVVPGMAHRRRAGQFQQMLDVSHYESLGIGYRLPERVYAETET
ncbi:MAG: oxygenase MpaB family protein [Chthoniobacterales bacterium]